MRSNFINISGTFFIVFILLNLFLVPIYAQTLPERGEINPSANIGLAPLVVKFTLEESSYYQRWDFGDGSQLDERNPTHIYTKPGAYTIKVIFRNEDGKFQVQRENLITVYEPIGLGKLILVKGSNTRPGQPWDNAVDGDIYGEDGTASPNEIPSYAIFRFIDSNVRRVHKIRVLGDTKIDRDSKRVKEFRVQFSKSGIDDSNFVTVWNDTMDNGGWLEKEIEPTETKYIKFFIDKPDNEWSYVGEIEVYSEVILVDSLMSSITATSPHVANGVEISKIQLILKDENGNPVTGKTENDITFFATGEANKFSNFQERPNPGEYSIDLTSLSSGEKEVIAFVNGLAIQYVPVHPKTRTTTLFTQPEFEKGQFIIIDSSQTRSGENWSNAFDGDIDDSDGYMDGTVGCIGKPSFMTVQFADKSAHWINKMRLLTDTKRGFEFNWADHFTLLVSDSTLADGDFIEVLSANTNGGDWQEHTFNAVRARYIKFIVDKPDNRWWRQIGELEIYTIPEPTPIELASFDAKYVNDKICLKWITVSETNNYGFELERRFENSAFAKIGFVHGAGTSSDLQHYYFEDNDITDETFYYYRLKQLDTDGTFVYSNEVSVSIGVPSKYDLDQNYPNPFNPVTLINYKLSEAGFTTLIIMNALGQEIKQLVNANLKPGKYQATWDGTDDSGQPVAAGLYFYRFQSNDFVSTKRMTLLK